MRASKRLTNATHPMFMAPEDLAAQYGVDSLQARWLAFGRDRSLVGEGVDPLLTAGEALQIAELLRRSDGG